MAGNELEVCRFLVLNLGKVQLNHIGLVEEIAAPISALDRYELLHSVEDLPTKIDTNHSGKKADVYLNKRGVSIKQAGGSFPFNRLQRKNLFILYTELNLANPRTIISIMDEEVKKFHQGLLPGRDQPWQTFFVEQDFKTLLKSLMLNANPNLGLSNHIAEFILEASRRVESQSNLILYSFDEYFDRYKHKLKISIRRVWIGQASDSEHGRALSISSNIENLPWVFDNVAGQPNTSRKTHKRWRDEVAEADRKTVYFLMIEKKK